MRTELVTPPAEEPVSLAEAKRHLRVDFAEDDPYITGLIKAARQVAEMRQNRALVTSTYDRYLDAWPYGGGYWNRDIRRRGIGPGWLPSAGGVPIELPRPPLQSVTWVHYLDQDGAEQELDPSLYRVKPGTPGKVEKARDATWPTLGSFDEPVTIRFVAGYASAAAVPESTKQAMLLLIGQWYQSREAVVIGTVVASLPFAVDVLLGADDWGGGHA